MLNILFVFASYSRVHDLFLVFLLSLWHYTFAFIQVCKVYYQNEQQMHDCCMNAFQLSSETVSMLQFKIQFKFCSDNINANQFSIQRAMHSGKWSSWFLILLEFYEFLRISVLYQFKARISFCALLSFLSMIAENSQSFKMLNNPWTWNEMQIASCIEKKNTLRHFQNKQYI